MKGKVDKRSKEYRDSLKKLGHIKYTIPKETVKKMDKIEDVLGKGISMAMILPQAYEKVQGEDSNNEPHAKQLKDLWATIAVLQEQVKILSEKLNNIESKVG